MSDDNDGLEGLFDFTSKEDNPCDGLEGLFDFGDVPSPGAEEVWDDMGDLFDFGSDHSDAVLNLEEPKKQTQPVVDCLEDEQEPQIEDAVRFSYVYATEEWIEDMVKVKIQKKSFAQGAMRAAYRMEIISPDGGSSNWVAKGYRTTSFISLICTTNNPTPVTGPLLRFPLFFLSWRHWYFFPTLLINFTSFTNSYLSSYLKPQENEEKVLKDDVILQMSAAHYGNEYVNKDVNITKFCRGHRGQSNELKHKVVGVS
eukprot:TRINITY_DN7326_c0_g1_i11.p1 TRINITY_DN7326_c0_g1~~TRINITY_DN7326_c0_g1_i11.p1  ORF type:complete len:256 (-),score=48.11 TRINITY_DN7326_c0_g1_i11:123-890(-)